MFPDYNARNFLSQAALGISFNGLLFCFGPLHVRVSRSGRVAGHRCLIQLHRPSADHDVVVNDTFN